MAAKPRSVVIIGILALTIAAVAAYSLYTYLMGQQAQVKSAVATSKIVVAAQDIGAGTAINSAQVKTVNWPQSALPQGASSSADQVVARVTIDRFTAGEPIVESKLVPKEGQPGILTYKIPEGHRAMTVGVDPVSGVAGFVMPGNRIDVVLTVSPSGQQQPVSKIVLQDVPVLAIGQTVEQQKEGKALVVPTVTMDVAPDDAEKLAIASTQGKLQLVLRRAGDAGVSKTTGETVIKVMGSSGAKAEPTSAPKAASAKKVTPKTQKITKDAKVEKPVEVMSVEVWRNNLKTTETFKIEKQ